MIRSTHIVAGVIALGVLGAGTVLLVQPEIPNGTRMATFTTDAATPYIEIEDPSGFVNTNGITIGELVGKKVILIDFMTYSCINCIRTFPYVNAWYDKYRDQGLEIVGIHTPEFAFEKDIDNVREALAGYGIAFPVVLDNEYATWRAYGNRYWPRKYLIDIDGNIVYDHIGEGAYVETEKKIQELLAERAARLGLEAPDGTIAAAAIPEAERDAQSPEIYFGSSRNERLAGGKRFETGMQSFELPSSFVANALYLGGSWDIMPEHAASVSRDASIVFRYRARDVFMVASSPTGAELEILHDGMPIDAAAAGKDVLNGSVQVRDERLYELIRNAGGEHLLEIRVKNGTLEAFTFTFG